MTDLITRARKEWCEPVPGGRDPLTGGLVPNYRICPPSVVSALLDVVDNLIVRDVRLSQSGDEALRAIAAIERALEQKA